jgi:SAM-dependent methyltransferase
MPFGSGGKLHARSRLPSGFRTTTLTAIMNTDDQVLATDANFNEYCYLAANPDVFRAVASGKIQSGRLHFKLAGQREGRRQFRNSLADIERDRHYLDRDVPATRLATHCGKDEYLREIGNKPGLRVLEVGSREVTGKSSARERFKDADYVGFDLYGGNNVDVIGDAHRLSDYFDYQFDLIYSYAVFEHLAMPWVVAEEIAKTLKVGGTLLIETHCSFSVHERPWHFFQFSDMALKCLFSPALGFECIEAGMSNPIVGHFSSFADAYLRGTEVGGLYCHSQYLGIKRREVTDFRWRDADMSQLVEGTTYPSPRDGAADGAGRSLKVPRP